jgi:O-antigen biosynthesis protein
MNRQGESMFFYFLKRILMFFLAVLIYPCALALALFSILFDMALAIMGLGRHDRNSEDKVLLIQSAEPAVVLDGLKHLKTIPRYCDSSYAVFCRNHSEILKHFAGHPLLARTIIHSETQGWWKHWIQLRRERFDTVVIFFTGDPGYWKVKFFAFFLGGRHKLIFDENNHSIVLSLRAWFLQFERDLLFSGIFHAPFWRRHTLLRRFSDRYQRLRSRMAIIPARSAAAAIQPEIEEPLAEQNPQEPLSPAPEPPPIPDDFQRGLPHAREMIASLAKIALDNFLSSSARFRLPSSSEPEISIILVLYNRAELTLQCLRSLAESGQESIEIIIVDNASTDATSSLLNHLDGATILRNSENLHFLKASNLGARQARGRYILFLNNDTQVFPGTLQAALRTLESSQDIGAVGGKLILPDGSLQEAGSIVWRDGSCLGYGRGANPLSPEFMFRRNVDYCSGAFLLTRRETFLSMGGFDELFQPFYYEETDYCLRLWERGLRVVYEPDAALLHYEFASSSSSKAAQEWHAKHQGLFLQRHFDRLKSHYDYGEDHILKARSAGNYRCRVLLVDDRVPHPALGSGFPRSNAILSGLVKFGCQVTFYPTDVIEEDWREAYSDIPREVEVMLGYGPWKLDRFLASRRGCFDLIFISRPHNMQYIRPILQAHPDWFQNTRIIYDAEALFTFRDLALQKIKGHSISDDRKEQLIRSEIELVDSADLVVSVSNFEGNTFAQYGIDNVRVLGHSLEVTPSPRAFDARIGILFVGSIQGEASPNGDAVLWFLREIFPLIQAELSKVPFMVAGMNKADFSAVTNGQVRILGKVPDLTPLYDEARIFVAPTRFSAGIPHKIHEASARGIPVVATSLLAQQLGWSDGVQLLVADNPKKFAEQCIRLYRDAGLWERIRQNALDQVRQECSPVAFKNTLESIIENRRLPSSANSREKES